MNKGIIIKINKGIYTVKLSNTVVNVPLRGNVRKADTMPLVGDNCILNNDNTAIEKLLERKNSLIRPQICNIDKLFIITSTHLPEFSSYLLDKFLVIAHQNNIKPIIIFTKLDMLSFKEKNEIKRYIKYYKSIGYNVYVNNQINHIKKEIKNNIVALTGQTGVGKSTLLNKIDKKLKLQTDEVSISLGRGKHTTRIVQLINTSKGLVADTPGFSSLELNVNKNDLKKYFIEFNTDCKYTSCLHDKESNCKVKENKRISKFRYDNYIKLLHEL